MFQRKKPQDEEKVRYKYEGVSRKQNMCWIWSWSQRQTCQKLILNPKPNNTHASSSPTSSPLTNARFVPFFSHYVYVPFSILIDFVLLKELEFIHKCSSTVGYRPNVFSTTLSHLIATNSAHFIIPFIPIRGHLPPFSTLLHFEREYPSHSLFCKFDSLQKGWKIN